MSVDLPGARGAHDGGEGAAREPDGDAVEGVDGCLSLAVAAVRSVAETIASVMDALPVTGTSAR